MDTEVCVFLTCLRRRDIFRGALIGTDWRGAANAGKLITGADVMAR